MIRSSFITALPLFLAALAGVVEATTCNTTTPCPTSAPCCSEFGFCGTGSFCLGGCNPYASKALDSCRPAPLCKDATYTFTDLSRVLSNHTLFDGNASAHDWVVEHGAPQISDGNLALILTETNGGTRLSSTNYVHYGTITAKLKTGRWAGIVTAFITMSDIKDEIDWEFPGQKTTEAQSNFFWQGNIPDRTAGDYHGPLSDTFSNFHDYTIDWQPDALRFLIDGKVVRTVEKATTVGADGITRYPSTPSRVQLSIWPAGIPSSPKGTVDWAGGMIDFNNQDYKDAGQFYALVKEVSVKCTGAQPITPGSNITSYIYGGVKDAAGQAKPQVIYSNATTLLNGAMGLEPVFGRFGSMGVALALGALLGANALLL